MTTYSCTACETVNGNFVCHACEPEEKKSFIEEISGRIFHSLILFVVSFSYFFRARTFWDRMNDKARFRFDFVDFVVLAVGFNLACMQFWSSSVDTADKQKAVADAVKEVVAKMAQDHHYVVANSAHLSSIYGLFYDFIPQLLLSIGMTVSLVVAALPMAFPFFPLFNRNKDAKFISYLSCLGIYNALFSCLMTLFRTVIEASLWHEYPKAGADVKALLVYPTLGLLAVFLVALTRLNKYAFKINYAWATLSAILCVAVQTGLGLWLQRMWPGLF